jgi:hypothetical protein
MATDKSSSEAIMQLAMTFISLFADKSYNLAVCIFSWKLLIHYTRLNARFSLEQCSGNFSCVGANYSENEMTENINLVVKLECLKHDTLAVHLF